MKFIETTGSTASYNCVTGQMSVHMRVPLYVMHMQEDSSRAKLSTGDNEPDSDSDARYSHRGG